MPQNAFSYALSDTVATVVEPIQGTLTTLILENLGANTIYLDTNNPLLTSANAYPLVKDAVMTITVTPSTVIYALGSASSGDVLKVLRAVSPLSVL